MEMLDGWDQRLNTMFEWIDAWQSRMDQPPMFPAPASSVAADDRAFPLLPTSAVAYNALLNAVEHLDFFRASLTSTKIIYPAAYYTVLRSALMGAAQAVWVLAPANRATRVERSLRIVVDNYNQYRKLVTDTRALAAENKAEVDKLLADLDDRISKAAIALNKIGIDDTSKIRSWSLNMTQVIKDAVELVHPQGTSDGVTISVGTQVLWRSQSGFAHGTPASRLSLIGSGGITTNPDGSTWGRASTKIDDIAAAAAAPVLLLNEAWRLYDLRRT
ncbi:hypothetical protein NQK81_02165 [Amycolatopsis roodepoortensis]|uniref:hypothetical protein n=1 Tax=Amycolatopsis roodepoortensis TaxID=700274 RepID=UPI00214BEED9|nr:hypothetical protein [Amycolatopsis roodepoortensis]UUV32279.1 hypothetical protein NQK81_02165 [Amycolatopsis roodepoortensis]